MRILYVTTVSMTMGFFPEHIKMLQAAGHTVELACNLGEPLPERVAALGCKAHPIPFSRSPFSRDNLTAYKTLKRLLAEHHYDIVHTHTPNASALVRLACRKLRKDGLRVFYTAHGFHFYTGAPAKTWLIYYPVEKFLSRWTDVLITMNGEDYRRARTFRAGRAAFVHGVGVEVSCFRLDRAAEERRETRRALGVADGDLMLLSVGELIHRKNHETAIRALARLEDPSVKYFICGGGPLKERLEELAGQLGVGDRVKLLGVRRDIPELDRAADLFLFPSFQEGLPVALMEAMASGLPAVCSDIRGNRDLIENEAGGILCRPDDPAAFAAAIRRLREDPALRRRMGERNSQAVDAFSTRRVLAEMKEIYGI